jgi:methionine sulfoxide reductase heme-binding subunit
MQRRVRAGTALAAAAFTLAVVLARGFSRPPRFRHHHLVPAMNAWTSVSRSLGIAALVLLAATLPVGLLFGRRLVGRAHVGQVRAAHMTLSVCALIATAMHILTLLGASRLGPDVARLVVPGLWPYRETATALGVASAYALAILGPSYYARRTLGARRWRIAHRFVAVGLALAILHVVGGG